MRSDSRVLVLLVAVAVAAFAGCGDRTEPTDDTLGDAMSLDSLQDGSNLYDTNNRPDGWTPDNGFPDGWVDGVAPDGWNDGANPDAGDTAAQDTTGQDTNGPDTIIPIECGNPAIPTPASGNCQFTSGSNYLLLRGDVFGPANILRNAMVLIDPVGFIVCADCDCSDATGYAGATVIACPEALITPGLINGHDHVTFDGNTPKPHGTERYDHRHEWRTGANGATEINAPQTTGAEPWAELRHVIGGATSMFGSGDGQGLLRNLDTDLIGIEASYKAKYDTFPLGDQSGTMLTAGCAYKSVRQWSAVSSFRTYIPHIAEGINDAAHNEFVCMSAETGGGQDLVRENTAIIHGIGLNANDIGTMAVDGAGLIWAARSNVDLYGNTAAVTLYDKLGVEIGIGPDWTASGSMNMLRELNCVDNLNTKYFNKYFSDRRIIEMATKTTAKIFKIEDKVGSLKSGLLADIAIFSTKDKADERALIEGTPKQVLLTMRGGIPLYGDVNLVDGLLPGDAGCEALEVCGDAKKVCAKRETAKTVAELEAVGGYDLFFCGKPDAEPSCEPSRPGEYSGTTATDSDGDGVPDATDNCKWIFNPVRPMDKAGQADFDADGVGDVCDPCPLDANTSNCKTFNPEDSDGDGKLNDVDNCPRDVNVDQDDGDEDGKGDLCDECAEDYNPGTMACPSTVYDVKRGEVAVGRRVGLTNMIVTAVAMGASSMTGFFMQANPDAASYDGASYSGIYVYSPGFTPKPAVGAMISLDGTVTDYHGQIELTNITNVITTGTATVPSPLLVVPTQVATGGSKAVEFEGVLVYVADVTVTNIAPAIGGGDKAPINEFIVGGGVRVNDLMFLVTPFPAVNAKFASITGVLRLANDNYKIEPRNGGDVIGVAQDLAVTSISPAKSYFPWGEINQTTTPVASVMLNRLVKTGETVNILIETSDPADLFPVSSTITIPVGQNTADIYFSSGEPATESMTVNVCATYGGVDECADVVLVSPEDSPAIVKAEPVTISITKGESVTVNVTLDMPVFTDGYALTLTPAATGIIAVPATVPIALETTSVTFNVSGSEVGEGVLTVTLGADSSVTIPFEVLGAPAAPNVLIAEVFYNHSGEDSGFEWIKLYNNGTAAVNLAGWTLATAGTSWDMDVDPLAGNYELSGTIPAGGCFVVGGPTADAENGNPVYDLVLDFDPDIQNSGTTADGIALFNVPPGLIEDGSVPVDVVIYGKTNTNGLIGPSGDVAVVNIGNASDKKTIARKTETTWEIRSVPTPKVCPTW